MNIGQYSSSRLRPESPDFLDLPWHLSLEEWSGRIQREEYVPRGSSRHPVVFVNYDGNVYALKELPPNLARREYEALSKMQELRLPVVNPIGHIEANPDGKKTSVMITQYLNRSLPYQTLFSGDNTKELQYQMLDSLAGLLVQLHLAGVFWGDCSLANTLFKRDAGTLQAYLVDAETAELHETLTDGQRQYDLDIMEENVTGGLLDLLAQKGQTDNENVTGIGSYIRQRYEELWKEINDELLLAPTEQWKIQQRIRKLNELGFSVKEMQLNNDSGDGQLRLKVMVADRHYHSDLLHSLTGLNAEEQQARVILNEIYRHRVVLSEEYKRSIPLSSAAFHWQAEQFNPIVDEMKEVIPESGYNVDLYCDLLEHKWYMSEKARTDVGHARALDSFVKILKK